MPISILIIDLALDDVVPTKGRARHVFIMNAVFVKSFFAGVDLFVSMWLCGYGKQNVGFYALARESFCIGMYPIGACHSLGIGVFKKEEHSHCLELKPR